jgi:hypothetical protein
MKLKVIHSNQRNSFDKPSVFTYVAFCAALSPPLTRSWIRYGLRFWIQKLTIRNTLSYLKKKDSENLKPMSANI